MPALLLLRCATQDREVAEEATSTPSPTTAGRGWSERQDSPLACGCFAPWASSTGER
jgi:hypothetical protein